MQRISRYAPEADIAVLSAKRWFDGHTFAPRSIVLHALITQHAPLTADPVSFDPAAAYVAMAFDIARIGAAFEEVLREACGVGVG